MITAVRTGGTEERGVFEFTGLSSDTKPTGEWEGTEIDNSSSFFEMDTKTVSFYDGNTDTWV